MKSFLMTLLLICIASSHSAYSDEFQWNHSLQKVEVPLEGLLAPYFGYDDTNNLEVTLHGNLPNPCYRLEKATVEKIPGNPAFRIRQYAVKKNDGVCGEENAAPEQLKMLVPFTNVVSLDSNRPGDYKLIYTGQNYQTQQKVLNVKEAHKTTVDDYPYAAVSIATTSDVVPKNRKLEVALSGVYTSSCAYLDNESVKIEKQNDVYVILPIIKMRRNTICAQSLVPFVHKVELDGPEKSGHYLIHVRSMNGKSINHVVEAID